MYFTTRPSLSRAALTLLTAVLVSGCGDEGSQPAPTSETRAASGKAHRVEWLELKSALSPAQWLASRGEETARSPIDPDVMRIATDLADAHAIYRESERMIANRAVQLEGMLRSISIDQNAASIVADLARIPGEIGQTEGFGAVTQHYFILRSTKVGREEALAALKTRYGPRK
ncbi:MAG: hypothetical protein WC807_11410 [Hyphomicrobium sp.]|jgi:hypothetical protein